MACTLPLPASFSESRTIFRLCTLVRSPQLSWPKLVIFAWIFDSSFFFGANNLGYIKWKDAPLKKYHLQKLSWWEHCRLVGALSSGVNAPTWFMLKITFLLLAFCFTAMLALAFSSKNFVIVGHVLLLVTIGTVLFVLLNRFLAEVGLVPVEQQMQEIGIHKTEDTDRNKRK